MSNHTRTPWKWIGTMKNPKSKCYLTNDDNDHVLFVEDGDRPLDVDADFILSACNAHDDLLAAAVNLLSTLSESDFTPQPKDGKVNVETKLKFLQLRNAVNKAKGQS